MRTDGGLGRVLHGPKVTTEPPEQPVATGKNRPKTACRRSHNEAFEWLMQRPARRVGR